MKQVGAERLQNFFFLINKFFKICMNMGRREISNKEQQNQNKLTSEVAYSHLGKKKPGFSISF